MARAQTVDELTEDLRRLGVAAGDLLMVHTSMRKLGPVVGGADGLIDALTEAIGPTGTLLVNIGVRDDMGWVNERPESERAALLADSEPFDTLTAPADPDNGVFAEVFRTRPGTIVSDHPEGRFGSSGRLAGSLVSDVPWNDYYGNGSPLERFVDAGGRVLRLGADIDTVTLVHYAENIVPLPDKRRVRRHRLVSGAEGPVIRTVECFDDSAGIVDLPDGDYFTMLMQDYLASGGALTGTVGEATSELLDGRDLVDFAVDWMLRQLVSP